MKEKFWNWFWGDSDVMEGILDGSEEPDASAVEKKREKRMIQEITRDQAGTRTLEALERKGLRAAYLTLAILCCVTLIGVLLVVVANLPMYGQENPRTVEVVRRYVESGLQETGAVNIVSGMILDYRAFDTLGESHVLFTALICVMILLRKDKKNMQQTDYEDYYTLAQDQYYSLTGDEIIRFVAMILLPGVFLYGIYVLLNGQNSPGGGFSGGAVLGAGMIIFASASGFERVDRFFTLKISTFLTFCALSFYSFAKGYVFFTGANHLENHIPKGTPGAILSGGLILPLDIAVGLVVACTMFGFYSLFKRGSIGGD